MAISIRRNKFKKYRFLIKSRKLRRHIPETAIMTKQSLFGYIDKYGDIIVKPLGGSRGAGVIRISGTSHDKYEVHYEDDKYVTHKERLYQTVKTIATSRRYIVQQRVPLAAVGDRPFDMRVIVQRKTKTRPWTVTGKVAKVAGEGYIVTNIARSSGTVLPLKTAIRRSTLGGLSARGIMSDIDKVAVRAASRLCKLYTKQRIFGFDMGLGRNGHVWIIEANLSPMLSHFRKLKRQSMYRRIMKYKRG